MDVSTPTVFLNETNGGAITSEMSTTDEDVPFWMVSNLFSLFWQIVAPLILVSGLFGNVMIIVICRRANVMSSLSVYFVALAGSELMSLGVDAFTQWVYRAFYINLLSLHTIACKVIGWLVYVSGSLTIWILVAMTAQRAVCVLWPHRASNRCSARNSQVIALSMSLLMAVLHCHLLYGLNVVIFSNDNDEMNNVAATFNDSTHSTSNTVLTFNNGNLTLNKVDFSFNSSKHNTTNTARISTGGTHIAAECVVVREYVEFYFSVWSLVDLLVFSVVPWLCFVVCNSVLLWTLKVSIRQAQHSLGSAHTSGFSRRKKQASSMTVTLFTVSTAFIILISPMSCVQILGFYHHMVGSLDYYYQSKVIAYFYEIALALWQANSAVNFYLYCLTGSKFRRELMKVFSCATTGVKTRAAEPSLTGTTTCN